MKIALTDYSFPDREPETNILRPLGHEVVAWKEKRSAGELVPLVADAEAVSTLFAPAPCRAMPPKPRYISEFFPDWQSTTPDEGVRRTVDFHRCKREQST